VFDQEDESMVEGQRRELVYVLRGLVAADVYMRINEAVGTSTVATLSREVLLHPCHHQPRKLLDQSELRHAFSIFPASNNRG
jgi:hypothetical protein